MIISQGHPKLLYIELIRFICIICVVCFHTVGMMQDRIDSFNNSYSSPLIMRCCNILVGIAVPMFMFISGYLSKPIALHNSNSSKSFKYLWRKANRLLMPYIVFTILIMLSTLKFDYTQILGGGYNHLWFLTALFWCFVCGLIVDYSTKWAIYLILPLALLMTTIHLKSFAGIQDFVQWYFFFALGAIVKNKPNIINFVMNNYLYTILIGVYILIMFNMPFHYREKSLIHTFGIGCLIMGLWGFIEKIDIRNSLISYALNSMGLYSMGIYIMHFWLLIFILSSTAINLFALEYWGQHALSLFFVISIITFILSLASCIIIKKIKYVGDLI